MDPRFFMFPSALCQDQAEVTSFNCCTLRTGRVSLAVFWTEAFIWRNAYSFGTIKHLIIVEFFAVLLFFFYIVLLFFFFFFYIPMLLSDEVYP